MKPRKTFDVSALRDQVNALLAASSDYVTADQRRGAAHTLETILHATGNYAGFNYLGWMNGGHAKWLADGQPEDRAPYIGDKSRRFYFTGRTAGAPRKVAADPGLDYPCAIAGRS